VREEGEQHGDYVPAYSGHQRRLQSVDVSVIYIFGIIKYSMKHIENDTLVRGVEVGRIIKMHFQNCTVGNITVLVTLPQLRPCWEYVSGDFDCVENRFTGV
jgi:hypothetical protein